nr:MAG TPA: acetyltransferase [Microviridae sp.]
MWYMLCPTVIKLFESLGFRAVRRLGREGFRT